MWLEPEVKIHAPEIEGHWLNSQPLSLRDLRGRVVLIDFWDYTCLNCIRTLPYLKEWHRRYQSKGLTIVGVHTPEFSFAQDARYVESAAREFGLEYPLVLDNDFETWQAYANRCWPAKYLIDKDGYVRYCHYGEGAYRETEEAIQRLLGEIDPGMALPSIMQPLRETDRPGARCYPVTPELYLGFARGHLGNEPGYVENQVSDYRAPAELVPDVAYLDGPWYAGRELIEACPLDGRPSRILLRYTASEVNLVLSPAEEVSSKRAEAAGPLVLSVVQNGRPLDPGSAGEDISREGRETVARVREPRMYRLVKNPSFGSQFLEVSTDTPGIAAYAFTFGSCLSGGI